MRSTAYGLAYAVLWIATLFSLKSFYGFETTEALSAFVILGLVFPALSMLVTRAVSPLAQSVRRPGVETTILLGYLVGIAVVLVHGFPVGDRIVAEPLHSAVLLVEKLVTFVALPATILMAFGRYRPRELMPASLSWKALRPALWMSIAVLLMQSILGRGLQDVRNAQVPAGVLALATPLCFAWLVVEVGVVEEFFFRVLLQERLAAYLRSSWGGLVVAAILFGLVHAPGLYLRPGATQEAIGAHPPLFLAVGYSIVLTSLAGLFLGVLWMRTRNFAVVAVVHTAGDLLPNLVPWMKTFHLLR
jgi:uncharacterized protein